MRVEGLDCRGQRWHRVERQHCAVNLSIAARGQRRGVLAKCSDEPELVERRWAQAIDEPADVADRGFDACCCSVEQTVDCCGIAAHQAPRCLDHQDRARERRPETVV